MISQLILLITYLCIGIVLEKSHRMPEQTTKILSRLVVLVTTPCTIISSFMNKEICLNLDSILVALISSILALGILTLLARGTAIVFCDNARNRSIWQIMILFSNNIFLGFPILGSILGEQSLIYATLYCIPCNALMFTYGAWLIMKNHGKNGFGFTNIFNTCTFASVCSLGLVFVKISFPKEILTIFQTMGNMSTPLSLICMGMVLAATFNINILSQLKVYIFCFCKTIITAVSIFAILFPFLKQQYSMILYVLAITASLPPANIAITFAEAYGGDSKFAADYVSISTVLFLCGMLIVTMILKKG